jgi:hypothetical protein
VQICVKYGSELRKNNWWLIRLWRAISCPYRE